jgi:hypothetical protein
LVNARDTGQRDQFSGESCVRRASGPDEHIFISFSLSVHEAVLELRTKLKIDIKSTCASYEHQQMQRKKYELPR